jgi:hypothetical protein
MHLGILSNQQQNSASRIRHPIRLNAREACAAAVSALIVVMRHVRNPVVHSAISPPTQCSVRNAAGVVALVNTQKFAHPCAA